MSRGIEAQASPDMQALHKQTPCPTASSPPLPSALCHAGAPASCSPGSRGLHTCQALCLGVLTPVTRHPVSTKAEVFIVFFSLLFTQNPEQCREWRGCSKNMCGLNECILIKRLWMTIFPRLCSKRRPKGEELSSPQRRKSQIAMWVCWKQEAWAYLFLLSHAWCTDFSQQRLWSVFSLLFPFVLGV